MSANPNFQVNINYPKQENKLEFDIRIAKAVASVLMDVLPLEKIDEFIDKYNIKN